MEIICGKQIFTKANNFLTQYLVVSNIKAVLFLSSAFSSIPMKFNHTVLETQYHCQSMKVG